MFKDLIGKRVLLRVSKLNHVNYVGTLAKAKGNVLKLVEVTPQREVRQMSDMVINFACGDYSALELASPEDDPSWDNMV